MRSERLDYKSLGRTDIDQIVEFQKRNYNFFSSRAPKQESHFLTHDFWQKQIEKSQADQENDRSYRFTFSLKGKSKVLGFINFTQVFRGPFQACYVGYGIDEEYQGKGLMSEALGFLTQYMFKEKNIHRIMANYMPDNHSSASVLKRIGFVREGIAKDYLCINGVWEDHILTSLTNPNWSIDES